MDSVKLSVANCPVKDLALTNLGYVSESTYQTLLGMSQPTSLGADDAVRCAIKSIIVSVRPHSSIPKDAIGLNKTHRISARLNLEELISVKPWEPQEKLAHYVASSLTCELGLLPKTSSVNVRDEDLEADFKKVFHSQVFSRGQTAALFHRAADIIFSFSVLEIQSVALGTQTGQTNLPRGIIDKQTTEINFIVADGFDITLATTRSRHSNLFRPNFDFQQLGIGGLDKEFTDIFRRAFASRIFPNQIISQLGIQHVRGMLLHGPPGTGKTLIARQIGRALKAREPKIVNGPEILNKFVGQSEENIRNLFKDAEEEYKKKGNNSSLHIIIFDEIDAICKQRGNVSSGGNVGDSIVNQLLSKIDGVTSLNNILLIGMTNRIDLVDQAILRPGRLEVHVEIGLPDVQGRHQILMIHTSQMRESKRLAPEVDLMMLAEKTKNFSGAELAGLVRSATSYAFTRCVNVKDLTKPSDVEGIRVTQGDFEKALEEVRPAFGIKDTELSSCLVNGIIEYSSEVRKLHQNLRMLAQQVAESPSTLLLSSLLVGDQGAGKTAVAAHVAKMTNYPFIQIISPNHYVGFPEYARVNAIREVFENAYKSKLSLIIIDCVERLLDYTSLGTRFSNTVLQALLILIKKPSPTKTHRLFIMATSSEPDFMEMCGLTRCFHVVTKIPLLEAASHIKIVLLTISQANNDFPEVEIDLVCSQLLRPLAIKNVISVYEMASEACSKEGHITAEKFLECLKIYGY